jgi:GNAT superfamily N-acetyltransferase
MSDSPIRIVDGLVAQRVTAVMAQIEAVFWQTSARTFPPGVERVAFRDRWLGRYMRGGDDVVLLAIAGGNTVAGYLVGALADPAQQVRFNDLGYFRHQFADLTRRFPAHLHINLDAAFRGRGLGARMVEAFAERARRGGARGMHVITGKGMRNARFYARCGFEEQMATPWNGGTIVFLGKELGSS